MNADCQQFCSHLLMQLSTFCRGEGRHWVLFLKTNFVFTFVFVCVLLVLHVKNNCCPRFIILIKKFTCKGKIFDCHKCVQFYFFIQCIQMLFFREIFAPLWDGPHGKILLGRLCVPYMYNRVGIGNITVTKNKL